MSFFVLLHALPVAMLVLPIGVFDWAICAILYVVRMFFITAGYHRYFAHRSFKTGRVFQFILAFMAMTSLQKGVIWWASNHRRHHRYSDTIEDPHSPWKKGFFEAHIGWIWKGKDIAFQKGVRDLFGFPELIMLDKYHFLPGAILATAIWILGCRVLGGSWDLRSTWMSGLSTLVVGFGVSTLFTFHATFLVNSLGHLHGSRRFPTNDQSRNNWLIAMLTFGEGWHNNHHANPGAAKMGVKWWELDLTYYILIALERCRLIYDVRRSSRNV